MMTRSRPDSCLSDYAFDRWLGGELSAGEETAARDHVATCERCARRWSEIRAERDAFAEEAPRLSLRVPPVRARRASWIAAASGLLAAAAAVALFVRGPHIDGGTRAKGADSRFGFYVSHAGVVRLGGTGERVEPGDALRFVVDARDRRYVAVLSVDGAKHVSTYYAGGATALESAPGATVALPLSTVLDDTLGSETIYGVACPRPFETDALREALVRAPDRTPALEGCDVDTISLRKEAPLAP